MTRLKPFLIGAFFLLIFCADLKITHDRYGWKDYRDIVIWDTEGYYIYLPAVFIYHGFENIPNQTSIAGGKDTYLHTWPGTTKTYTKYTCGEAILISPFYLLAHAIAVHNPHKYPPDGFSEIYMLFFVLSIAFYLTLGLFLAWLILRRYFSEEVVLLGLICIWIGTSFIQYTAFDPGNSHVFSFFLITLLVFQTPYIYKRVSLVSIFFYSITFGGIVLLRPTNAAVVLYPLLYGVRSMPGLRDRIGYFWAQIRYLPIFIIGVLLILFPQFFYWKSITGHWIIFSYVGEGFFYWKNPKVIQVLFAAQNGFFVYAPVMLLAIPGFIIGWKDRRLNMPLCLAIILIAIYTFGSWSCWWYGASYGHRAFIDFFIFFLFPLCSVISRVLHSKTVMRYAFITLVFFLLFLSYRLNQTYSYPWEGPDWGWKDVASKYKEALYIKK